jgi:hypothetical protein
MGGKSVNMKHEMSSKKMKENQNFVKVFSFSKKEEKPRFLDEDITLYCAVDNNRCDGTCRKKNSDKFGNIHCSEVITDEFLPKKRRRRKRFKRREREEDF